MATFGQSVKQRRLQLGLGLRELARDVPVSPGFLSRVEAGQQHPSPAVAKAIDRVLHADGAILACLPDPDPMVGADQQTARLSQILGDTSPADLVTDLGNRVEEMSLDYLALRGPALVTDVKALRAQAAQAMRRTRRPDQLRDLVALIGYLSGVLAYAALDSGSPESAKAHVKLAWQAGENAGSDQLRAWVRGTQSLIARFGGDYDAALEYAEDGLRYRAEGTATARLLSGVGQCHANMGDARAARRALTAAATARDEMRGHDEMPGLFGFSEAKLAYYSGSSLIWLSGGTDAERARTEAHTAIGLWENAGRERSIADEALAHVYAATASVQLHDLEAAAVDLEPILALPPERRISWIAKRLVRVAGMLATPPFDTDPLAAETLERIREYR